MLTSWTGSRPYPLAPYAYAAGMAERIHLVRHGEVTNPDHLVYASLPGFDLSPAGAHQAQEAARYLGRRPVVGVWSSPLERALRTAEVIAVRLSQPVKVDQTLTEWQLMERWKGTSWDDLPVAFPGELEALLEHPHDLEFSPESLESLGTRMSRILQHLDGDHPHGDVVVVSHSGPLRAAVLTMTGRPFSEYWSDGEPSHGSVTTFRTGPAWSVETTWAPDAGLEHPA